MGDDFRQGINEFVGWRQGISDLVADLLARVAALENASVSSDKLAALREELAVLRLHIARLRGTASEMKEPPAG